MRYIFLLLLLTMFSEAHASLYNHNTLSISDIKSSYGINAYLLKSPSSIIVFDITIKDSGYAHDPYKKQGLANVIAYILKHCDTKQMSNTEIQKKLALLGAYIKYEVEADHFYIQIHCLPNVLHEVLTLLNYKLFSYTLTEELLEYAKTHIKLENELKIQSMDVNHLFISNIITNILTKHPYLNNPFGIYTTIDHNSVDNISLKDIKKYLSNNINRINNSINVFGSIKRSELSKTLDKYIIEFPLISNKSSSTITDKSFTNILKSHPSILNIKNPDKNDRSLIYILLPEKNPSDAKYYPTQIIRYMLTSGILDTCSNHIFPDDFQHIPSLIPLWYGMEHIDIFPLYFTTMIKDAQTYTDAIINIFNYLKDLEFSAQTLKDIKVNIINTLLTDIEQPEKSIALLRFIQNNNLGTFFIEDFINGINNTTAQEIKDTLEDIVTENQFMIIII